MEDLDEVVGRGDGLSRIPGCQIHRRGVELEIGTHLLQIEAHGSREPHQTPGQGVEGDLHPIAPLPFAQDRVVAVDLEPGDVLLGVEVHGQTDHQEVVWSRELSGLQVKDVGRALEAGVDGVWHRVEVGVFHRHQLVVGLEVFHRRGRLAAVPAVGAVLAAQVDRAHPGERPGLGGRRRVVPWNPVDLDLDAGLVEDVPESDAAAVVDERVASQGNRIAEELDARGRLAARRPRRRGERLVGLGIPVDEVEHAVAPGVSPGDEVRPGHRALRRGAGSQPLKGPLLGQTGEVGHAPFVHQALQDHRIHAVDAEDEDPGRGRLCAHRGRGHPDERTAEQNREREAAAAHLTPPFGPLPARTSSGRPVLPELRRTG